MFTQSPIDYMLFGKPESHKIERKEKKEEGTRKVKEDQAQREAERLRKIEADRKMRTGLKSGLIAQQMLARKHVENALAAVRTRLRIDNACCEAEATLAKKTLHAIAGVDKVSVNVVGRIAYATHRPHLVGAQALADALNEHNLGASVAAAPEAADTVEEPVDYGELGFVAALLCLLLARMLSADEQQGSSTAVTVGGRVFILGVCLTAASMWVSASIAGASTVLRLRRRPWGSWGKSRASRPGGAAARRRQQSFWSTRSASLGTLL